MTKSLYQKIYGLLAGEFPNIKAWHFQWLATYDLHQDLLPILSKLSGSALDVGCGQKPYQIWMKQVREYKGIDTSNESAADIIVDSNAPWPIEANRFDSILCTQVLEHARDFQNVISEMARVVKPGGVVIVSIPFIYARHGTEDYWRFTAEAARRLFEKNFIHIETRRQGGIGSTLGTLLLNWIQEQINHFRLTRDAQIFLLPLWLLCCLALNLSCKIFDYFDFTKSYYSNVLIVAKKP